jgi:hypothetical protein
LWLRARDKGEQLKDSDMSESDHSYLQERARRFRRIAGEVSDKSTRDELKEIAEGLDAEACSSSFFR